jgi:hypothetical protein
MNPQRDALSEALHELAAEAPEASPELHARLDEAFLHHHSRRRLRNRAVVVMALIGAVAISVYWLRPHGEVAKSERLAPVSTTAQTSPIAAQTAQSPIPEPKLDLSKGVASVQRPIAIKTAVKPRTVPREVKQLRNNRAERPATGVESADFVALPTFDPAIPLGESRMIRMDLTGSALQLIGYPVDGQLLDRRIVTDVLVGQDGMPYAVRLVHARNVR